MLIPNYLLEYAQINREVVILGLYNRIEIWSAEVYKNYKPDGNALNQFAHDLGF
ncbi:MAG TPA: division/cell wall cluster transcriptional repressor MraZ [Spirochaetota bacterium]|nr:division/cell wall cluster transcriptional repressor MraZ [Spirochaetota bacterium]